MNALFLCLAAMSMDLHNSHIICENSAIIIENSQKYDISPELIVAVGRVESRWTLDARSHANACGVLQVIPKYTKNPKRSCKDLKKPEIGIQVGAKKLKYWIYRYGKGNKSVIRWEKRFKKVLIREKQKYEDKNLLDYLFSLVRNIGDYR
jgi:hypothetical protein